MTFPDGSEYDGEWLEDAYSGSGTFNYANGDIYKGDWLSGQKNGVGKYFFKSNGSTYEGTWEEGAFISGKWVYKDGSTFEGGFKEVSCFAQHGPVRLSYVD